MNQKNAPIIHWFVSLINFSIEKLNVYSAVKCFDCEIKNSWVFDFILIYKGKEVFY